MENENETESPFQHHNRIAYEIAEKMLIEFPNNVERMVLIESIVSGSLRLMCQHLPEAKRIEVQHRLFRALIPGIEERLNEK